jgi:hypothetical protein
MKCGYKILAKTRFWSLGGNDLSVILIWQCANRERGDRMRIRRRTAFALMLSTVSLVILTIPAEGWTSLPVVDDQNLFMPGTQPGGAGTFRGVSYCEACHGGYDEDVEPAHNWRGSMMAQAARDPLWLASLAVADQDSIWALGNPNAGDLCIRCHSPTGWLEGRSDPTNTSNLTGNDFDGVSCDFCHRMVDPFAKHGQSDVPPDTDPTAISLADQTYLRDIFVLDNHTLFDASPFLSPAHIATSFGNGKLPNYIESTSGQFFVDPSETIRGPYWDINPLHSFNYSRFHQSKMFCLTCHDVSNSVLASVLSDIDVPETQAAASYFHVERTASEFLLSAYGQGGAEALIPGVDWASTCQDCHMRDVSGKGALMSGAPVRDDLPLHDLTGGNQWILKMLASSDAAGPTYDQYNYDILSGQKYPGAQVDVAGIQGHGQALLDGAERVGDLMESAANLTLIDQTSEAVTLRVQNNGGHKLLSGFPEGRRVFLNVKFYDKDGNLLGEINPYDPLVTTISGGNEAYVSGGILTKTHEKLVWEAIMSSSLTGENKTFHVALATDRYKDNRIPPKGFDTTQMNSRMVQPRWNGEDAPNYFTSEEYAGGYDEVTIDLPSGTVTWNATLYYQTTSKEYVEFLRDEINGDGQTLASPAPSGELLAYIIQDDPFFSNLKGWGDAMWDLWLHNDGNEPVQMTSLGGAFQIDDGEDDEEPSFMEEFWWLALILVLVLILGLVAFRMFKKRSAEEPLKEEEDSPGMDREHSERDDKGKRT